MKAKDVEDVLTWLSRESSKLPRPVLEMIVFDSYAQGFMSAGKAAEFLGLSLSAFLEAASRKGIAVMDATPEELADELRSARG